MYHLCDPFNRTLGADLERFDGRMACGNDAMTAHENGDDDAGGCPILVLRQTTRQENHSAQQDDGP